MADVNNNKFEIRKEDFENSHLRNDENIFEEDDWINVTEIQLNLPSSSNGNQNLKQLQQSHEVCKTEKYIESILSECNIENNNYVSENEDEECLCFIIFKIKKRKENLGLEHLKFIASLDHKTQLINYIYILKDIYCILTATNLECPDNGLHWQNIGFQSANPSTDLRSLSILSLLCIHNFCTEKYTQQLANKLYLLSKSDSQNFPFCILCMNVVNVLYSEVRKGSIVTFLTKDYAINQFLRLFSLLMSNFYKIWKMEGKTITDSQDVLNRLRKLLTNNLTKMIQENGGSDEPTSSHQANISIIRCSDRY